MRKLLEVTEIFSSLTVVMASQVDTCQNSLIWPHYIREVHYDKYTSVRSRGGEREKEKKEGEGKGEKLVIQQETQTLSLVHKESYKVQLVVVAVVTVVSCGNCHKKHSKGIGEVLWDRRTSGREYLILVTHITKMWRGIKREDGSCQTQGKQEFAQASTRGAGLEREVCEFPLHPTSLPSSSARFCCKTNLESPILIFLFNLTECSL